MSSFKRVKHSKDKNKADNQGSEKGDNKIHIQRQQAKYGEIHSEFKYFLKSSEQQNYFSNQIQNYKQLLDSVKHESHKKEDQLKQIKKQLGEFKTECNNSDLIKENKHEHETVVHNVQQDSKHHKRHHSSHYSDPEVQGFQIERASSQISQFTRRNSTASIAIDNMKFKKLEHENNSFYSTMSHSMLHYTQVQAFNMKAKIQSAELNLEQLNERILLEEQSTEILTRMSNDNTQCIEKVRLEINLLQDVLKQYMYKVNKVSNSHTNFSQEQSAISIELKRAKFLVDKETQFQQSMVQQKINLFQTQNKTIKDSVKQIQKLRNKIVEQEKQKQKQIDKIERLEDYRLQKEVTKKDSELFVKNIEEIDLILKYFIYRNPQDLPWGNFDINKRNYDSLFSAEFETKDEQSPLIQSVRPPTICSIQKEQANDQSFDKKSQTSILHKFPSRDQILRSQNIKKSNMIPILDIFQPKVQQNQIVDKVSRFMTYHQLTSDQIFEKLAYYYNQMIIAEGTLKNRLSNLMSEREHLLIHIKYIDEKLEQTRKDSNQHQFLAVYEQKAQTFIKDNQNCIQIVEDTINQIIQKQEQAKIPELQLMYFKQSEKFTSFIFYSLNELIFRWSSFLCSIYNLSSSMYKEESRIFFEQVKKRKEFSKKINNLVNYQLNNQQKEGEEDNQEPLKNFIKNIMYEDEKQASKVQEQKERKQEDSEQQYTQINIIYILQQFQRDALELHNEIISDDEIKIIYTYLRNDFVLANFLAEQVLDEFLQKVFEEYKTNKDKHTNNPFEQFSSYCLDNINILKATSDKYFKSSLQFLIETLLSLLQETIGEQEFLNQIITNLKQDEKKSQLDQFQLQHSINSDQIVSFQEPPPQSAQFVKNLQTSTATKQDNLNQNMINTNVSTSQKKQFRRRVIMMKCREFNDYFGFEVHRKHNASSAAQTIVDVIYETLYDMRHGNSTDIFDVNQELSFFQQNRDYAKNIEKEETLKLQEENLKREEEMRAREKSNKTYLMKSPKLEFNEKENKLIAQIEKKYNQKIKENMSSSIPDNQKNKVKDLSEKQIGQRRNLTVLKMRETYSHFHTKHALVQPINLNKDSDSSLSQSQIPNQYSQSNKKKDKMMMQQRVQFSRSSSIQQSSLKIGDMFSNSSSLREDTFRLKSNTLYLKKSSLSIENSINYSIPKKEKKSLFQSSKTQDKFSPAEEFTQEYPLTERFIPSKTQNQNIPNSYFSELKDNGVRRKSQTLSFQIGRPTQNEDLGNMSMQIEEGIIKRGEGCVEKSENEKEEENNQPQKYTSKPQNKFSLNLKGVNKDVINSLSTVQQLNFNKFNESEKKTPNLKYLQINKNKCHLLMRNSFDKLIKIPTPLAPIIANNQRLSLSHNSNHKPIKLKYNQKNQHKSPKGKQVGNLTDRPTNLFQQNNIFNNPTDYSNTSLIYSDQFPLRQAYLISRQSRSTNFQSPFTNDIMIPNQFYFTNFEL